MSDLLPEPEDDLGTLAAGFDEPPSEDDELAAFERDLDEFPSIDDLIVEEDERPPLGKSWAYDFAARRFVRANDRAKGPLKTYGLRTLETWIEKCLRTERGAHPVHSDNFGIDDPFEMIGKPISRFPSDYEARLREALLRHPRITDVTQFKLETYPDEEFAQVSFYVEVDTEQRLPFVTNIGI